MTLSGLTGSPARYSLHLPAQGRCSLSKQVSGFPGIGKLRMLTHLERNKWAGSIQRCSIRKAPMFKCAMDASFGDATNDSTAIFPRINIGDPYKRLGISREASEEEIQAARNFLIQRYGGHKPSVDAIESAHDKIIMRKFHERKNPKIDIKKKVRAVTESRIVQVVLSRFRTPPTNFIIKTSVAFVVLGALTILFPTEEGPTLQVAISLMATLYFIYDRLKSKLRAALYGAGAFMFSWLFGTFLMVSVIPPILKGPRSLEITTSLITYALLWVSSTYLE
ncbi:protein CHAPERONE-LIKE PROTEIN OF POR1, chloroplastic isoform X1 [Actinidia eriantha]|uniref:protein CHAPERONE-LIKE PROTEIN OF POR1, chloroplastic isoform X1 n=1 Tax=Actinidia eriantha TaxID=165200 RepID=UPI00258EDEB2|nr:protein CHAPERONE-LIKE PROTEIN OF POR1, chloroplastic isoform X1 [Actinidia eriantha]